MHAAHGPTGDRHAWALVVLAAMVASLGVASARAAGHARHAVSPGVLIDPFGHYSTVRFRGFDPTSLRFPDRLVRVDGRSLVGSREGVRYPASVVDAELVALRRRGVRSVALEFARGRETITLRRALRPIELVDVAFFWGLYFVAGALVAWSGLLVLALSRRNPAAIAYGVSSVSTFVFLATFFDYHTSRALVPLFSSATVWLGAGCLLLALHFPVRAFSVARTRAVSAGVIALTATLNALLVFGPSAGLSPTPMCLIASAYAPAAGVALVAALVLRRRTADDAARREVGMALGGMLVTLAVVAVGILGAMLGGITLIHSVMPLVIVLTPLSVSWALVRRNVLDVDLVLTRRTLVAPALTLALGLATSAWLVLRMWMSTPVNTFLSTAVAALVFVGFLVLVRRASDRVLFPAKRAFRPTIQLLAESLTGVSDRDELTRAIEQIIAAWLPTAQVRLLSPEEATAANPADAKALGALRVGQASWTDQRPSERHLLVPMFSQGILRGVLDIAPKHQGALFTEDDVVLLQTVAALGAIALHNIKVVSELEAMRKMESEATHTDKSLTLGVLGAELSHEIAHPLQFFRGVLSRGARRPLDEEDLDIGREEIDRLDRMLASLRRLEAPRFEREVVSLADPARRALVLVRDALAAKGVTGVIDVPDGCVVRAHRDGLVQVFSNLLRNAVQAAPVGGTVGVRARDEGRGVVIDVWDDGPGVPDHLVGTLFHRWVTNRASDGGTGLGLSVAHDLVVTVFEWEIQYVRNDGVTCFRLTAPAARGMQDEARAE